MAKKQDEILDREIGSMGNEEGLGKIQRPEVLGRQAELSNEEKDALEAFRARASKASPRAEVSTHEEGPVISDGWIPVDRSELGIRSQFYPEDWEFFIRPATVQAIKNWTAIDEERPDIVNKVFNEIIRTCVRVSSPNHDGASWASINSWDRFWFIIKVREFTFARGETSIQFEDTCSICGEDMIFKLTAESLFYEFPDEDLVEKYWNGSNWQIDPTEYDVPGSTVTLYTPKLAKDEAIIEWATAKVRSGAKIDEVFLRFLPWMLNKVPRDPQALDRLIQKCLKEYKSWDVDMFSFMDDVVRNITINPSEQLSMKCPHCGGEAISNVQFPNGIKVLFNVPTKAKKFGSR